ncbi:MAG: hypothetical protein NZ923_08095 [Candidatus Kryptonium sp.]|nr:hypothetical protein [Candidatus Kryptonium sp.]
MKKLPEKAFLIEFIADGIKIIFNISKNSWRRCYMMTYGWDK